MRIIETFGLKRSGHHAVVQWIVGNLPHSIFINDPLRVDVPPERDDSRIYQRQFGKTLDELIATQSQIDRLCRLKVVMTNGFPPSTAIYNVEDKPLNSDASLFLGIRKPNLKIIVLRDVCNNFASRIKTRRTSKICDNVTEQCAVELWKEQAKEFLNPCSTFLKVNFNNWFKLESYRNELGSLIGLPSVDKCVQTMAPWGGGSSFDKMTYNGNAQQMDVMRRYQEFKHDHEFWALLDKEARQLSCEIFGSVFPNQLL